VARRLRYQRRRTPRNTNLLVSNPQVWLIDHVAALYLPHRWAGGASASSHRSRELPTHLLLPFAPGRS